MGDRPRRALTALRLAIFRNHAAVELALDRRMVALFGPNGAGKTNILEAVSLLAPGRGLRRAASEEIARRAGGAAAGAWAVSADLDLDGDVHRLGVGQDPAAPSRRLIRLNGAAASHADLGDLVRVTWLTPAQDRIFAGPRGERLKFFDRLVLGLSPGHGAAASRYERAMRERTKVLEEGGGDRAWLDGLEDEMAQRGGELALARAGLLDRLRAAIDARPSGAFPKSDLDLEGPIERLIADGAGLDAAVAELRARLFDARRRDARAGRALVGPHRTDFAARHRAKNMPAGDCSTGEQKALLVGLALAHGRALDAASGTAAPLLLLDEACAHLDEARRAALADELADLGVQAWLTGTDAGLFEAWGDRAQRFQVEEGAVREAQALA